MRNVLGYVLGAHHSSTHKVIDVDPNDGASDYFGGLRMAAEQALPQVFEEGMQVMSGHYRYRDITPVLGERRNSVSLVTFLRDPVRRTLSDYYYTLSDKHPDHEALARKFPTFEHYVRQAGEMNKQIDFLQPFESAPLDVTIESALHNLDFIGITESFESDAEQLARSLGASVGAKPAQNVNANRVQAEDAHRKYRDMLEDVLAPEIALYNALSKRRRFPR